MDRINGAVYCKEQDMFNDIFQKDQHYQIFYNKGTRNMIFRQKKNIFQIHIDNHNICKMEIPFEGPIYDLQIKKKERYVAYSIAHNLLGIVYLKGKEGKESRLKISKENKMDPIMHFEWIYGCDRNVDFVLCKQSGVVLYKLDTDKHQLKEQKIISLDISATWFDPYNQILCCANTSEDGRIHPFYFHEKKQGFKYKGVEFKVESSKKDSNENTLKKNNNNQQSNSMMNFFQKQFNKLQSKLDSSVNFVTVGDNRNKDLSLIPKDPDVCHKISLVVLYNKTFLVYLNPFHNKIFLYQLSYDKIIPSDLNIVSPSENGIRFSVADNLLIIHSTTEHLSLVYDVRSRVSAYQIGPPQCLEVQSDGNGISGSGISGGNSIQKMNNSVRLDMLKSRNEQNDDDDDDDEEEGENNSNNNNDKDNEDEEKDDIVNSNNNNNTNNNNNKNEYHQYSRPQSSTLHDGNKLHSQLNQQNNLINYRHSENTNNISDASSDNHNHLKQGRKQSSAAAVKAAINPNLQQQQQSKLKNNNNTDLNNKSVEINIIDPQALNQHHHSHHKSHKSHHHDNYNNNNDNDNNNYDNQLPESIKKQSLLYEDDQPIVQIPLQQQQQQDQQQEQQQEQEQQQQLQQSGFEQEDGIIISQIENTLSSQQQIDNDTLINAIDLINLTSNDISNNHDKIDQAWNHLLSPDSSNKHQFKSPSYIIFNNDNNNNNNNNGGQGQNQLNNNINNDQQSGMKDLLDVDDVDDNINNNDALIKPSNSELIETQATSNQNTNNSNKQINTHPDLLIVDDEINRTRNVEHFSTTIDNKGLIYQLDKNVFTQDEFILNSKERKFCTIKVDINRIEKLATDEVEGFNVIIRRANSKEYGLLHMRQQILKNKDIRYFAQIFNQILKNHSYEIIDPGDIYYLLFLHLYTNMQTNKDYLTQVLSEFVKSLIEHEIVVDRKFQNLLARLLIEQQKYNTFLFYVQYRVITDNEELAYLLIQLHLSQQFKQGFQLGLDMLFRLKKHHVIFNLLIKRGLFQQGLDYLRKYNVNYVNYKDIIKIFLNTPGDMTIQSILEFFKENTSKSRGNERFGFSFLEFIDELHLQQQQMRQTQISYQVDLI